MKSTRSKTSKPKKRKTKRTSRKPNRTLISAEERPSAKQDLKTPVRSLTMPSPSTPVHVASPIITLPSRPVFSIEISSINGDTTIGDLIVAFPRTRDVLMKHGLRFDVEQAGYLYMTLSVFSAIHGLTTNSLVQELHIASKEPPPQPPTPQLRPITTTTNV
jgi:hypothetical protein